MRLQQQSRVFIFVRFLDLGFLEELEVRLDQIDVLRFLDYACAVRSVRLGPVKLKIGFTLRALFFSNKIDCFEFFLGSVLFIPRLFVRLASAYFRVMIQLVGSVFLDSEFSFLRIS